MLLQLSYKARIVTGWKTGMHSDHVGGGRDVDNGREVAQGVVRNFRIDGWIGRSRGNSGNAKVIAIGNCFGSLIGAHNATTTGLVVDNHTLA